MAWIREGECNRCGDCCKGDPGRDDMARPGAVEGYCPLFAFVDGLATCNGRDHAYYLAGCNVWPNDPGQLTDKPNCSYTFRWEE
jgi:hypothetical protein